MRIQLFYTSECPTKDLALDELRRALEELGLKADVEEIFIADEIEARSYKIIGTPTIRVNGVDIDPEFRDTGEYTASCTRVYRWAGSIYQYPPKEMIKEGLRRILKGGC
ncbi:DF family (seleno)protein [Candidatus Methanodesulfokora washburnensis]|jgi:hypothetical protein|uniref:DF family (seleno)protein n=1 Tax=Candidatus Methanodesulfokora washburnensis TaxID=2478471 RepID=UPI001F2F4D95|nr:DUF2703 domain-containing protein [Candidatus Methanodesulfokores washburnensis]